MFKCGNISTLCCAFVYVCEMCLLWNNVFLATESIFHFGTQQIHLLVLHGVSHIVICSCIYTASCLYTFELKKIFPYTSFLHAFFSFSYTFYSLSNVVYITTLFQLLFFLSLFLFLSFPSLKSQKERQPKGKCFLVAFLIYIFKKKNKMKPRRLKEWVRVRESNFN